MLITAFIWGSAFVAQRVGMDFVEPYTFNAVRMLLGGICLLPLIIIFKIKKGPNRAMNKWEERRHLFIAGFITGFVLFLASGVQQIGMVYTTAGKAGFISALYIVIVPLLSLFLHKKVPVYIWIGVVFGLSGLYLLCMKDSATVSLGDILIMASAFLYAVHILVIDYFAPRVDCVKLSCTQFFVAGFISLIPMFILEKPHFESIVECRWALLYAGVLSTGVAYTLQVIGQKNTNPAVASLILSLESVFAVITGTIILHEVLSPREITGCALMFFAIIIAQFKKKRHICKEAK